MHLRTSIRAGSRLKPHIVSATNAVCKSYSNVTYFEVCTIVLTDIKTVGEGDIWQLFCSGLRTGATGENVFPHRPEVFKKANNGLAFP